MKTDNVSNQLRWVILLLAAAVILPTVCLLWFMNQAVRNERLAVRSRLVDVYKKQFELSRQNHLNDNHVRLNLSLPQAGGILVYNDEGKLTFPVFDHNRVNEKAVFDRAHVYEYKEKTIDLALQEYSRISEITDSNDICIMADISQARCLSKLNRPNEAIKILHSILSHDENKNTAIQTQKCHAFLLLLDLIQQSEREQIAPVLEQFYDFAVRGMATDNDLQFLGEADFINHAIPSETQLFALTRFIEYATQFPAQQEIKEKIKRAKKLIGLIAQSLDTAQDYPKPDFVDSPTMAQNSVFRLKTTDPLYGRYRRARNHTRLSIFSQEYFVLLMIPLLEDAKTFPVVCKICDETNQRVTGANVSDAQRPFIKMPVSDWLPGWLAYLYVEEVTFEDFADKQTTIYLWTGILVALLVLSAGVISIRAVNRQIKMNRLKNDFIATVTHELKTPLASMRLLVDTLLEGNYEGEQTATEYLQLVANENKRLTHLIDSFLTFSRMERNKQVFDFAPVSPAEVANMVIESVRTKFDSGNVRFNMDIQKSLPVIYVDKDGIVTVLVNLLDNAYKYTNSDKQIELMIYEQNGPVCFAVKDNGIGLSPRAQRKIFNRFYQVDSRLSRRAEGCGLGLSIVKFIVDAHKGTIEVESQQGQGSMFTVKIPVS